MFWGAMFLPPAVTIRSFFRERRRRKACFWNPPGPRRPSRRIARVASPGWAECSALGGGPARGGDGRGGGGVRHGLGSDPCGEQGGAGTAHGRGGRRVEAVTRGR
jgi:hypothetical protein